MNIRKIIKEEVDDFDWVRDTGSPFDIKESRKIWLGNVDDENVENLLQSFKEMGWRVPTPTTTKISGLYLSHGGRHGYHNTIGWMGCRKPGNRFWGEKGTDCIEVDGKWYISDEQLKKDREYFDSHDYKELEGTESLFEQEVDDFDWIRDIPANPLLFIDHGIEFDEDSEEYSQAANKEVSGEIWVDVGDFNTNDKNTILTNIERILKKPTYFATRESCLGVGIQGFLIHCGDEDYNFVPQENNICCMPDSYEDFYEAEIRNNGNLYQRPRIDGKLFLDNFNLKEGEQDDFDWIRDIPAEEFRPLEDYEGDAGTRVRLRTDSRFYTSDNPSNPPNTVMGTITGGDTGDIGLPIPVKWDNTRSNSYNHIDLETPTFPEKYNINESDDDLDWVKESEPNFSDYYQYWGDEILERLPNTLDEVEEFDSGWYIKRVITLGALNQQINRYFEENNVLLTTGDLKYSIIMVRDTLQSIIRAMRDKDEGIVGGYARESTYERWIGEIRAYLLRVVDGLRNLGM